MKGDLIRLQHLLDACNAIAALKKQGRSETIEQAMMYHMIVIGEAAAKLSPALKAAAAQLPWSNIIAMRNLLVHEYFRVETDVVWEVAEKHAPLMAEWAKKELDK